MKNFNEYCDSLNEMYKEDELVHLNVSIDVTRDAAPYIVALLGRIHANGAAGHSEWIGFFSDGDGIVRPKITISGPQDVIKAASAIVPFEKQIKCACYDAG